MRLLALLAGLLALGICTSAASAPMPAGTNTPSPLELEWQSDEPGCDAENVAELALGSLGPSVQPRRISATAQLRRDGDDWVVQLDTRSSMHTGRRVLRSPSCSDLRQAIALLLAMILESEADPDSVELPADTARSSASAELRPVADVTSEEPRALLVMAQAGGSYGFGLQPGTSWGFAGSAGLAWRFLEASVRFTHWPMTTAHVPNSEGHIEVTRNTVSLALCSNLSLLDWLSVVPCVAPGLTFFRSIAVNTDEAEQSLTPRPGLNGTLDVRYWLPGQLIFISFGSGVVWERPQPFHIRRTCGNGAPPECVERDESVHQTPGLGGSLALSVGARF